MRKLFGVFTTKENLENVVAQARMLSEKVFVLELRDSDELLVTYNSTTNLGGSSLIFHRKKETNTLYSLNGLNSLIADLNGGIADPKYMVDWTKYRSCIILTQGFNTRITQTRIFKIV